jgi:Tol biopolymer transport system component/DNA-binding winged helix-turn-helix (wHTH) protein
VQTPTSPPCPLRFRDFQLNTRAGELSRNGNNIRLGENPLHLLLTLLEQPGEVVTREELRAKLWPEDTFVDFEDGLNHAVRKLREALGDMAEQPRFIETVPKRGYRFIAPVEEGAAGLAPLPSDQRTRPPQGAALQPLGGKALPYGRRARALAAALAALAIGGVAAALMFRTQPVPSVLGIRQITHTARYKRTTFLTDGARLYFTDVVDGHDTPMVVPVAGGEPVPIRTQFKDAWIAENLTQDNSELMLLIPSPEGHFTFWHVPVLGGAARRVGDLVVDDAIDTPDGRGLLYMKGSEIYLANADGTAPRKLLGVPGASLLQNPRWSPDGTRLRWDAFAEKDGRESLWEASVNGSNLSNLHRFLPDWNPGGRECCGNWTPDGRYYVFWASVGGNYGIWAVREGWFLSHGGSAPLQLPTGSIMAWTPLVGKDGKKVFFAGMEANAELSVYDSRLRGFVPYLGGISAECVDFSKDGQWVAYVQLPEGTLWRMMMDGSERLQLTFPPMKVFQPRWSPDGKRIAFHDQPQSPATSRVYVLPADGGTHEPITSEENEDATWSPDGNWLMFSHKAVSPDGGIEMVNLATRTINELPGSKGIFSSRWSPDGRYVAALTRQDNRLLLFDFRTQKWENLSDPGVNFPSWSKDGKFIYFFKGLWPPEGFFRVQVATRRVELVTKFENINPAIGIASFPWLGMTPDGLPLSAREAGAQEIYVLDVDFP